jgi:hypothetical protein
MEYLLEVGNGLFCCSVVRYQNSLAIICPAVLDLSLAAGPKAFLSNLLDER